MPIQFTEEQLAFQDMARRFANREVEPLANRIDAEEHTPGELIAKAAEVGLFGLYTPVEYGGADGRRWCRRRWTDPAKASCRALACGAITPR